MVQVTPSRQLTDTEKLRKVITELIETERTYVKVILSTDLDLDLSLTMENRLNIPHSCHGDDDPVEGGGDVSEARVLSLLYVVSQAGEGETSDNQNQNLNRGQGIARGHIRDKAKYGES